MILYYYSYTKIYLRSSLAERFITLSSFSSALTEYVVNWSYPWLFTKKLPVLGRTIQGHTMVHFADLPNMASHQEASGLGNEQDANHGVRQPKWFSSGTTIKHKLGSSSYKYSKLLRLLYRVTSSASMGINTKDGFESAMCKVQGRRISLSAKKAF